MVGKSRLMFHSFVVNGIALASFLLIVPTLYAIRSMELDFAHKMTILRANSSKLWDEIQSLKIRQKRQFFGPFMPKQIVPSPEDLFGSPNILRDFPGTADTQTRTYSYRFCECKLNPYCPAGNPGPKGPDGSNGEIGYDGADGDPGINFYQDPVHLPADHSKVCQVCPPGPRGPHGKPGPQGPPGGKGEKGPDGPPGGYGERGNIGYQGKDGRGGGRGRAGVKGVPGQDAYSGKGVKGNKGDAGKRGLIGPPGLTGKIGQQGFQGLQGLPGNPGYRGNRGDDGDAGPLGPSGYPGRGVEHCECKNRSNAPAKMHPVYETTTTIAPLVFTRPGPEYHVTSPQIRFPNTDYRLGSHRFPDQPPQGQYKEENRRQNYRGEEFHVENREFGSKPPVDYNIYRARRPQGRRIQKDENPFANAYNPFAFNLGGPKGSEEGRENRET